MAPPPPAALANTEERVQNGHAMRGLYVLTLPASACLMAGAAFLNVSSVACFFLGGASVLLASAPVYRYVVDLSRPNDPLRRGRHAAD
jgi:hypothetical protein